MRQEAGFTLIEMLVALALTSMIAVAGSVLLVGTVRASDRLGRTADAVNEAELAHTLLRDDFANVTGQGGLFGLPTGGSLPFIAFVRDGWNHPDPDQPRASLIAVEYLYAGGTLTRRAWLRPDPVSRTPHVDRRLATGLQDVSVRYFNGREWLPEWQDPAGSLPKAVELRLDFGDNDTLTELFLVGGGG